MQISLRVGLAALLVAPTLVGAQPTLRHVTLWNSAANGASSGGWWNTIAGDGTYDIFLSTLPDGSYAPGAIINPATNFSRQLALGANVFYFYASSSASTNYGLNLFFGDAPIPTNAAPDISAVTSFAGDATTFSSIAASVTSTRRPDAGFIAGSGALSYTSGSYTVTLTRYDLLATAGGDGGSIDRVNSGGVGAGTGWDNYGTFTLDVTSSMSQVPEPATVALMGGGLVALAGVARARRRRDG
jgi:hypothetical protein